MQPGLRQRSGRGLSWIDPLALKHIRPHDWEPGDVMPRDGEAQAPGEERVTMGGAEAGATWPHSKELAGVSKTTHLPPPPSLRGAWACDILLLDVQPSEVEENSFCFPSPLVVPLSQERHPTPYVERFSAAPKLWGPRGPSVPSPRTFHFTYHSCCKLCASEFNALGSSREENALHPLAPRQKSRTSPQGRGGTLPRAEGAARGGGRGGKGGWCWCRWFCTATLQCADGKTAVPSELP